MSLDNVFYVPDLSCNLLSVSKLVQAGFSVHFAVQEARIGCPGGSDVVAAAKGSMYVIDANEPGSAYIALAGDPIGLWHRRLGHLNYQSLRKLASVGATGITLAKSTDKSTGKSTDKSTGKSTDKSTTKSTESKDKSSTPNDDSVTGLR